MKISDFAKGDRAQYEFKTLGQRCVNKGEVVEVKPYEMAVEWDTGGVSRFHAPLPARLSKEKASK